MHTRIASAKRLECIKVLFFSRTAITLHEYFLNTTNKLNSCHDSNTRVSQLTHGEYLHIMGLMDPIYSLARKWWRFQVIGEKLSVKSTYLLGCYWSCWGFMCPATFIKRIHRSWHKNPRHFDRTTIFSDGFWKISSPPLFFCVSFFSSPPCVSGL